MKKLIAVSIFVMLSFTSICFSMETSYNDRITYYQTFVRDAIRAAKAKRMIVQSRDGKQAAIVPKAEKEKKVIESLKGN